MTEPLTFPSTPRDLARSLRVLTVLRDVLKKKPVRRLVRLLDTLGAGGDATQLTARCASYAASLLPYSCSLEAYLKHFLVRSRNICVEHALAGTEPEAAVLQMLRHECTVLASACSLSPEMIRAHVLHADAAARLQAPMWETSSPDLFGWYTAMLRSIPRDGFGVFRAAPMLAVDKSRIMPVRTPDPIDLSQLVGYEWQRRLIIDNVQALLDGQPASDMLLYGDSGTGKSSTMKAVTNAFWRKGLRLIEVRPSQLHDIPQILRELTALPLKFVLFIDDLSFTAEDDNFRALKGTLEGSVLCRARNVIVCATSNRRRLIRETFTDRSGDDVHANETIQQQTALSDRFGLTIPFMDPNRDTYIQIVLETAHSAGLDIPDEELVRGAERFALEKGGRSGRAARQYADLVRCGVIAP